MQYFQTAIGTDISTAKQFLESGEVAGIPTETVYGLAGNALNEEAVLKIFSAKGRPHFDPLIVHTFSKEEIKKYVEDIPAKAELLIDKFMPGPLTILLRKKKIIPDLVTSGLDSVAIRIPDHPLTLQLLQQLAFPLAAPSANPFGYISPTTAQHVFDQLHGKIPYILDGGPSPVGLESTIIGFENGEPVVYRLGGLMLEEIEKVIGKVTINLNESSDPKSPGMLKSHYAPKTSLKILEPGNFVPDEFQKLKIGAIGFDKYVEGVDTRNQVLLSPEGNLNEAAKNLFSAMRKLDTSELDIILAIK
ncbi:MAG: Sua5/YciO/YrdC/YwlC family protein, partial [Bacteroidota bacterium]|nr:Sua5/YciO/YrdC/YwlC family protein [Bacteroidota bacterium]